MGVVRDKRTVEGKANKDKAMKEAKEAMSVASNRATLAITKVMEGKLGVEIRK